MNRKNSVRLQPRMVTFMVLGALTSTLAQATPLDDMVALDATYIPALAQTTAASQDAAAVPRARAALAALQAQWPGLQQRLNMTWGPQAPKDWHQALAQAGQHIQAAAAAAAQANWKQAHDALEPIRTDLMAVRRAQGMDYFVDSLTAFHEPMEALALAATSTPAASLSERQRAEMAQNFAHARALWAQVERQRIDTASYGLSAARAAQLKQALADETLALARLSDALRGGDNAQLLQAAAAIKGPFARAFIAFGQAPGETPR